MSQIKWQDFLNILTLKGSDTGILDRMKFMKEDIKVIDICYHTNKCYLDDWLAGHTATQIKSTSKSLDFRLAGNKVYQQGKDVKALHLYNSSVINAPYKTNEIALALANRSAVLGRLNLCADAIEDIELALKNGDSEIPRSKLLIRKALLLYKLDLKTEALHVIKSVFPNEDDLRSHPNNDLKQAYFDCLMENGMSSQTKDFKSKLLLPLPKGGENQEFPCASEHVLLKYSTEKGRHVIAKEEFNASDIIFVEKPFALVVLPDQYQQHCHHCCKEIVAFIPCHKCTKALFCSKDCEEIAWSQYHQWECRGLDICHSIGIAHLSLRVALLADSSDRYQQVFDLATHIEDMKAEDLYQYAITAVLLTLYLEHYTSYFDCNPSVKVLEMGCRILRHIAQLICNGHAITKINSASLEKGCNKTITEEQVRIATAIYPSASMMNHSCDQNISNSFINEYLIVRASRVIKKGEEVFNCYGPHYKSMKRDDRQKALQSQYFFKCKCKWCSKPDEREFNQFSALLCCFCSGPVLEGQAECADCKRSQPLSELMETALTAQQTFYQGQIFMDQGNVKSALACLEESVNLSSKCLYKHNSDLRTYKDYLARVYAESGRYQESEQLVEECIVSIEKQFGSNSIEISRELLKLNDLINVDLKTLMDSGLGESRQFRDRTEKMKRVLQRLKIIMDENVDAHYLNKLPGMTDILKSLSLQ